MKTGEGTERNLLKFKTIFLQEQLWLKQGVTRCCLGSVSQPPVLSGIPITCPTVASTEVPVLRWRLRDLSARIQKRVLWGPEVWVDRGAKVCVRDLAVQTRVSVPSETESATVSGSGSVSCAGCKRLNGLQAG